MRSIFFISLVFVLLGFLIPKSTQAQTPMNNTTSIRRSVATVIFCGVGGAVLGISTLSFYGDPQNHIGNITSGLVLGLLGGATYVALQASDNTKDQAQVPAPERPLSLDPIRELSVKNLNPKPSLAWAWSF